MPLETVTTEAEQSTSPELAKIEELIRSTPKTELRVLWILSKIWEKHAPAISRASDGTIWLNSIYTLLRRLQKRGTDTKLINKRSDEILVEDISFPRVVYSVNELVTERIQLIETILGIEEGKAATKVS